MEYLVKYVIDVNAETELEAALQVEQYMKDGHYRPVLEVTNNKTGITKQIDLENYEVSE